MHLVTKYVRKHEYFYLVEKARRGKRVVTTDQVYIGNRKRLAGLLQGKIASAFPRSFSGQEIGASLALVRLAEDLHIEDIVDAQVPTREGAAPLGRRLLVAAIHRALSPKHENGKCNLRRFYSTSAVSELLPMAAGSMDGRRVCEALEKLTPAEIDKIEGAVVQRVVDVEHIKLDALAFDATNFDSYAAATTRSRLLRQGKSKSGRHLRVLGLGALVAEEEGIPLLTFTYPGNQNDTTTFMRFLRALDRRRSALRLPMDATITADGGNISKQILRRLELRKRHYVIRLPVAHARKHPRVPSNRLPELPGFPNGSVRAIANIWRVYDKDRVVVDVYSRRMHKKQLPGLFRDRRKAIAELVQLQAQLDRQRRGLRHAKPLKVAGLKRRVTKILSREHMADMFSVRVQRGELAPTLTFEESPEALQHLQDYVLGRTLLVTDRKDWDAERIVRASREQSRNENLFRDDKDPGGVSMLPLRHRNDPLLRANALVVGLGNLLVRVLKRRLRLAGVKSGSTASLLQTLKRIQRARLTLSSDAPPALRAFAKRSWVPGIQTQRQTLLLQTLGLHKDQTLGTTLPLSLTGSRSR